MPLNDKILSPETLSEWRQKLRTEGKKLVATNGCFDILHAGHVTYLDQAASEGDVLLVGLNSDRSVQELKGPTRPINDEGDRATVIAALESVGAVCVFDSVNAVAFLELAQPDIYVKGGDYTIDTINQEERKIIESFGGIIHILPELKGRSTTNTLKKLKG